MSNIDFVPFENEHAHYILDQGLNSKLLELRPEHRKYAYYLKEVGMSFTGMLDNKPIAAGGVFPLWDGVAEGWVLATNEINNYPITFARVMKQRTDMMIANNKIKNSISFLSSLFLLVSFTVYISIMFIFQYVTYKDIFESLKILNIH